MQASAYTIIGCGWVRDVCNVVWMMAYTTSSASPAVNILERLRNMPSSSAIPSVR